jgi:hypothetical protein
MATWSISVSNMRASSGTGADCRVDPMGRARQVAIAAALILAAALLVAFGRTVFGTWHATGDHAVIELRTLDVGGRHTPLIGPYSRYGWSHPGPALFFALAPVLRLFGDRDTGTLAGAVVLNALALGCIFTVLWKRRDTAALVITTLVATVLVLAVGGEGLFDPWNPYVIVLPLLAAVICAWTAVAGGRWSLVATVVLASFVAQTHIGAAPAAIALVAFAFVWIGIDAMRAHGRARSRRVVSMGIGVVAGLIVWLPPMIQALTTDGGNLRAIWDFWTEPHPVSGFAQGARLVGPQFAIPAPWMGAHEKIALGGALQPSANRFPIALILLVVVAVFAFRRRDREAIVLCSLAATLALATWIAASRLVGLEFVYLLRWAWVAGATTWLAVLWTGWRLLPKSRPAVRNGVLLGAGALACVLAVLVIVSAARASYPEQLESDVLAAVRGPALAKMRASAQPVFFENGEALRSSGIATGLLLEAERAGITARLSTRNAFRVGSQRTMPERSAPTVLSVVSDIEVPDMLLRPEYRLLVRHDSLSAADRRELTRLQAYVDHDIYKLIALKRDHRADYDRLLSLEARGADVAVLERVKG